MEKRSAMCPGCKGAYADEMVKLPCGDYLCAECFQVALIHSKYQPQDVNSKITCLAPNCGQMVAVSQKFKESVDRLLQSRTPGQPYPAQIKTCKVSCPNHEQEVADSWCFSHKLLVCGECV